jgi:hypothetical protein
VAGNSSKSLFSQSNAQWVLSRPEALRELVIVDVGLFRRNLFLQFLNSCRFVMLLDSGKINGRFYFLESLLYLFVAAFVGRIGGWQYGRLPLYEGGLVLWLGFGHCFMCEHRVQLSFCSSGSL